MSLFRSALDAVDVAKRAIPLAQEGASLLQKVTGFNADDYEEPSAEQPQDPMSDYAPRRNSARRFSDSEIMTRAQTKGELIFTLLKLLSSVARGVIMNLLNDPDDDDNYQDYSDLVRMMKAQGFDLEDLEIDDIKRARSYRRIVDFCLKNEVRWEDFTTENPQWQEDYDDINDWCLTQRVEPKMFLLEQFEREAIVRKGNQVSRKRTIKEALNRDYDLEYMQNGFVQAVFMELKMQDERGLLQAESVLLMSIKFLGMDFAQRAISVAIEEGMKGRDGLLSFLPPAFRKKITQRLESKQNDASSISQLGHIWDKQHGKNP